MSFTSMDRRHTGSSTPRATRFIKEHSNGKAMMSAVFFNWKGTVQCTAHTVSSYLRVLRSTRKGTGRYLLICERQFAYTDPKRGWPEMGCSALKLPRTNAAACAEATHQAGTLMVPNQLYSSNLTFCSF